MVPSPGSDKAIAINCQCPRIDNWAGRGCRGEPGVFVINGDCPLHGFEATRRSKEQDSGQNEEVLA